MRNVESAVLSGDFDGTQQMRCGQRPLQPPEAVVALTEEGNLNLDVARKTPLSDWRRIDR